MFHGDRLKKLREEKGMSQEDLGNIIGVTRVTICGYENNTRTPKMNHFLKIIEEFKVSADYLLGRDIMVVSEDEVPYTKMVSKEEIQILNILQQYPKLATRLFNDPERTMELIYRKLYK